MDRKYFWLNVAQFEWLGRIFRPIRGASRGLMIAV
jgi:hypothetical protein